MSAMRCSGCGSVLAAAGAPCPRCLLALAFGRDTGEPTDVDHGPHSAIERIGPYRILDTLGQGGMGVVYLAEQSEPIRRRVALKVIRPGLDDAQILARFAAERQALAILSHPGIAKILDAGATPDGRPYVAMEYVPGAPITAFADAERLNVSDRLELFAQVCDAIQHAHQKGIIHRDIKPTNVLVGRVDDKPVAKVIDFGVAKATGMRLADQTFFTAMGMVVGTPEYMSPEQANPEGGEVDTRTDIYALGVLLYELLVGVVPFERKLLGQAAVLEMLRVIREVDPPKLTTRMASLGATVTEIAHRRRADPRSLARQLRGELEWITLKAMEKVPVRRYASASELASDVRRHLADEPVIAGPPSALYRLKKLVVRHKSRAAAAALVLVAIVIGGIASTAMYLRAQAAREEMRRQLVRTDIANGMSRVDASDPLSGLLWLTHALTIDPDRSREVLHRTRLAGVLDGSPGLVRLWRHQQAVTAMDVTTGGRIASGSADGEVDVWDLKSGARIAGPFHVEGRVVKVAQSSDGVWLLVGATVPPVKLWNTALTQSIQTGVDVGEIRDLAMSPDGSNYAVAGTNGDLVLADTRGSAPRILQRGLALCVSFSPDGAQLAAGTAANELKVWDTKSGASVGKPIAHRSSVDFVTFSPSGRQIATGSGQIVQVWDIATGSPVGKPISQLQPVASVRFDDSGSLVVTTAFSGGARVWTVATGEPASPVLPSESGALAAVLSHDRRVVAVADAGGVVDLWRMNGRSAYGALPHAGSVEFVAFDPSGRFVITGSNDGFVRVWDLGLAEGTVPSVSHERFVYMARFSPDGRSFATASGWQADRSTCYARVWDVTTGAPRTPPLSHDDVVMDVAFSPDGTRIATASQDGSAQIWDATSGEPTTPRLKSRVRLSNVHFSPDGSLLVATAGTEAFSGEPVFAWSVSDGAALHSNLTIARGAAQARFTPDGRHIVSIGTDGKDNVRVWEAATGRVVATATHALAPIALDVKADGSGVLTVGANQSARIWSLPNLEPIGEIRGFSDQLTAGSFSPDGRTVVVGGQGGSLGLRDAASGEPRRWPMRHAGLIYSASFSPDGRWVVTSSIDATSRVWDALTGEPASPPALSQAMQRHAEFAGDSRTWLHSGNDASIEALRIEDQPIERLVALAELLAARTLDRGVETPLSGDQIEARWSLVHGGTPPDLEPAPANWLRAEVLRAVARDDWARGGAALDEVDRAGVGRWRESIERLNVLGGLGRWQEGAAAAHAMASSGDVEASYYEILAMVAAGDKEHARARARRWVAAEGATHNEVRAHWIVRACALTGVTGNELALVELAERSSPYTFDGLTRDVLVGATLLRAGRLTEGLDALERAKPQDGQNLSPTARLFTALALAKSGRRAAALAALAASDSVSRSEGEGSNWYRALRGRLFASWLRDERVILRQEVVAAIGD